MLERWEPEAQTSATLSPPPVKVIADSLINWERLNEMTGGDTEETRSLLKLYLELTPQSLAAIRSAIASGDGKQVEQAAHSCAGSSATCGIEAMVQPLKEMEALAETGRLHSASALLEEICAHFETVKQFINKYLDS